MKYKYAIILVVALLILTTPHAYGEASKDDALSAIQQAEQHIAEMSEAEFSTHYVNDILTTAKQALERADFADLLRNNSTGELAEQARKALEGLDYEGFTYDEVLKHTQQIEERKEKAYELSDLIRATEFKIENYKEYEIVTVEADTLNKAKTAFENERYDETETLLEQANSNLDDKRAELSSFNAILISSRSVIEKNWLTIIMLIIIISTLVWLSWRIIRKRRTKEKLKQLKIEQQSLQKLMEEIQIERFKQGTMPESVYRIKMDLYQRRLNQVKQTIPVLAARLKKQPKKINKPKKKKR